VSLLSGCALFEVRRQQDQLRGAARLHGSIRTEHASDRPLVVVLAHLQGPSPEAPEDWKIVDHFVANGSGRYVFAVQPGKYLLGAFEDVNADLNFDPGEPVLRLVGSPVYALDRGDSERVDLVIPSDGRLDLGHSLDIAALVARSQKEQLLVSYGSVLARGEVISLDDPRFDPAHGRLGLWRPYDFLIDVGPGVYFLEPFDADKVPVLFVHGMSGHPREFAFLIDQLAGDRFQPWVFFYPSAADPGRVASSLVEILAELRLRYPFRELALVAHSMGGLVSRAFLLERAVSPSRFRIPLFVSIATPWSGHPAAASADRIDKLPGAMSLPDSMLAMQPQGDFVRQLFSGESPGGDGVVPRRLPDGVDHHLLFAYRRNERSFGASSDGRIDLTSQLRPEAQAQAASRFGVDAGHVDILSRPETSERLGALLDAYFGD
jgi:pimeloyl-ACP methyl ester carboxylesterase